MIHGMKGYWVYTAIAVMLTLMSLAVREPIIWTLPAVYFLWGYRSLSRLVFYISLAASAALFSHYVITEKQNETTIFPSQSSFQGRIASIPVINGQTLSFKLRLPNETVIVMHTISTMSEKLELQQLRFGSICRVTGTLMKPETNRNEGGFSYARYLYEQRIHWLLQVKEISLEQCRDEPAMNNVFVSWREAGIHFIEERVEQPAAGMMQALIYGERRFIREEVLQHYQEGGVIHLLAISGLHVGFLTGMLFYILIRMGMIRENAVVFLLLILPFYTVIAGAAPSVIRAVMMTSFLLFALLRKTAITPHDAISLAFLVMLAVDPYYVHHIGFQLSFIVSFFLIMSNQLIRNMSSFWGQLLAASVISQLSSLPLILYHFHKLSILSLPLNLLLIPLFSLVILPACLCILCFLVIAPLFGNALLFPLNGLLDASNALVSFAVTIPYTQLIFGQPSLFIVLSLYAALLWLFIALEHRHSHRIWAGGCVCLCLLFQYYHFNLNPEGRVTVIDVGQGDSILIELPYRKGVYLMDTGGTIPFEKEPWQEKRTTFEVGKDVLLPLLHARGIRHIDKLLITHGDYDHAGAAESILNHIRVKELVIGEKHQLSELEEKIVKEARSKKINVTLAAKGDMWRQGEFSFYILSPAGDEETKNNQSLVLFTELGGAAWLFTGDLEIEGEEQLLKNFPRLEADILKVGHHGSKTSTSALFLNQIKPKVAIISAGKHNRYQHPHSSVIKELTKRRIVIFRTDEHGAVSYKFRQNKGTFEWQTP